MREVEVLIQNKLGLHARASAAFVATASPFQSDIFLIKDGMRVNGKSIMGLMMLAAAKGTALQLQTEGPDEQDASDAIVNLINHLFGEGE